MPTRADGKGGSVAGRGARRALVVLGLVVALPLAAAAEEAPGSVVYKDKCLACHGESGAPTPPFAKIGVRDLSDPEWQASKSDAEIRKAIAKGSEGTLMRAFDRELDGAQIDALVVFVRSLERKPGSE